MNKRDLEARIDREEEARRERLIGTYRVTRVGEDGRILVLLDYDFVPVDWDDWTIFKSREEAEDYVTPYPKAYEIEGPLDDIDIA